MDKLLKAASIAWNPVGEARRRQSTGELGIAQVLAPFLGIVIACNLFALGAQTFFSDTLLGSLGTAMPEHPLLSPGFAQQMGAALGVLVPVGAVALLPSRVFHPVGKAMTLGAMLVTAAGWAFYGAAIGAPIYFFSGALATVDPSLGFGLFALLSIPMAIVLLALPLYFWVRIATGVLGLRGSQVFGISIVALAGIAFLVAFFAFVVAGSM